MGTSTVQRSPDSTRWRLVNSLYEDEQRNTWRLLGEVLNAGDAYSSGLADAASLVRLQALLDHRHVARDPTPETVSAVLRRAQDAAARSTATFYGDIAQRALHQTLHGGTGNREGSENERLLAAYVENILVTTVAHLVARDVWAHVGSNAIPDTGAAYRLRETLVQQARWLAAEPTVTREIRRAAQEPSRRWSTLLQRLWSYGKRSALEQAAEPR